MLNLLALATLALAHGGVTDDRLFEGNGPHKRRITTQVERAQQFFDQGLNMLYAFNQAEAERSFRTAARLDPESAMAWWGVAMANGPHYNNMVVPPEDEKEAVEAISQARRVMADEPAIDQALVLATSKRFRWPQGDRTKLEKAYSDELAKAYGRWPKDDDVGAFYAESLMNQNPWNLWTHDQKPNPGTPRILQVLEEVMANNPQNPMALHLYIHAVEAGPHPEKAVPAADRLRDLQPGLGHNVHMPSHIDVRVGAWQKAIEANQKAIKADDAYRAARPEQGFYWLYMVHNWHMLGFAAMMNGQKKVAVDAMDTIAREVPAEVKKASASWMDGWFVMPVDVRLRFGMWDEVLDYPMLDDMFPLSVAMQRAARAMAFAAKGDPKSARREQAAFYAARRRVPADKMFGGNTGKDILIVANHLMNGEIKVAEADVDLALSHLRSAVAAEDRLNYMEPPDWIQPTRHTLGALLLREGRYDEALAVFKRDQQKLPFNGWSLYGQSLALRGLGRAHEAEESLAMFNKVWATHETPINSSCLCIPAGGPR
ncbi:MAG: tetratricopeptide repeat protein [Fimbriimonadaceae bacterium]|nr:tetratricopeptide repeat protein [Fimbriimonadaceae bacterium]QYK55561.1 MAG: tetratricopeptide repeat protein [Fimbriimonadaceae bacterium]